MLAFGGHVELEEWVRGDGAAATLPFCHNAAPREQQDKRHLRRGIGVAKAADHRAAIADRDMRDMRHRFADDRVGRKRPVAEFQFAVAGHRLHDDLAILDMNARQAGNMLDVDEPARCGKAEVHGRDKALSAGKHHCVRIGAEDRDRFFDGSWRAVLEERRFHCPRPGLAGRIVVSFLRGTWPAGSAAPAAENISTTHPFPYPHSG